MNIQKEHTSSIQIQSYDAGNIIINNNIYNKSFLIVDQVISDWQVNTISDLKNEIHILKLINCELKHPIIIGHNFGIFRQPEELIKLITINNVSVEFMNIGSACRTFNIMQLDHRPVNLGIIFS